jgi:transketolase
VGFVNVGDTFAESGPGDELMEKYGLTAGDVVRAAEQVVARKRAG